MYNHEFHITATTSNNAFSYNKRSNPKITVPKIIDGNLDDVQIGSTIAFEDFDENGNLKTCAGLKNFIRTAHPKTDKPIIIVDNHNHVYYFWHEAHKKGLIKNGATLVHIDQHKDARIPDYFLPKTDLDNLEKIFEYTNTILNVGNYIPPAIEDGLIKEVISITSESELCYNPQPTTQNLIVNIDLDFWAPEMDYIDYKLKNDITRKWIEKADLITIATSPFFIDQKRAIEVLHKIM